MTYLNVEQMSHPKFLKFIEKNTPAVTDFKTDTGQQAFGEDVVLKIPNRLNTEKEKTLLDIAFRHLFHLNVARDTKAPFELDNLPAFVGNRLVKKKHSLNIFYDFQFVAAKTQIKSYLHNTSVTVNYNRRALRIYGRCYLLAQLELIAQTGIVPDKLKSDFYFLPKGSFIDEFEQMNKLALAQFNPRLTSNDTIQFHPTFNGIKPELKHTAFLLNDALVLTNTSETNEITEKEFREILALFFLLKAKQKEQPSEIHVPFSKITIYLARFGEMVTLDLEAYFGESLEDLVDTTLELLN